MVNLKAKGFEHYLISADGNVYNTIKGTRAGRITLNKPKLLKTQINKKTGYSYVVLASFDCKKAFSIHRLVALAYIKSRLHLPEVNHKNKNKNDNSVSNLEWVTKKQNVQHHLLSRKITGGKIYNSILNNKKMLNDGIEMYNKIGKIEELSKFWNCSKGPVIKILKHLKIEIKPNKIPLEVKNEIKHLCSNNNFIKAKELNNHLFKKYKITLTRQYLNNCIKENKKTEKNITKNSFFDFSFDI